MKSIIVLVLSVFAVSANAGFFLGMGSSSQVYENSYDYDNSVEVDFDDSIAGLIEIGYEFNKVVAVKASYTKGKQNSIRVVGYDIADRSYKTAYGAAELGYTFIVAKGFGIKPYISAGVFATEYNNSILGDYGNNSHTKGYTGGMGFRLTFDNSMYMDFSYTKHEATEGESEQYQNPTVSQITIGFVF
jgi:hypothetical protein